MREKIHETRDGDIAYELCKCHVCGKTARCTPSHDFYGEPGAPLTCEPCLMKKHFPPGTRVITIDPSPPDPSNN
jgi:hypothetical protein